MSVVGDEISEGMEDMCCTKVFCEEWYDEFPASEGIMYNFAEFLLLLWHFGQVHGSSLSHILSYDAVVMFTCALWVQWS